MKIGIVTPWFSDNISGGAERFAGGIAKSLQDAGCQVEVLTTCGKDSFWDWGSDFYEQGQTIIDELLVRRFSLRKRNKVLYDELMGKMIHGETLSYVEEMQLMHETVNSDELYNFITNFGDQYIFLFIPYLTGTTYWGSRLRPENTFIIPCLHDEEMAYFKSIGDMFSRVKGLLLNTIEELDFSSKLYNLDQDSTVVSGGGVEVGYIPNANNFRNKFGINEDYFIYVGRQVSGKNVPQLIQLFNQYIENNPSDIKLVFVGKGEEQIIQTMKASKNIIHIGEVSDEEKYDAIAGATALVQPSLMESFSIVIMESWLCNIPVIVHEHCAVTKGHCDRSQGGMYYKDYTAFEKIVSQLIDNPQMRNDLAANGKKYVEEYYTWSKTAQRIISFLNSKGFQRKDLLNENTN
ncbi:glycosyltransferase family 4 protein [Paenibacillus cremeus]|uniref:Glycosyltransferase family 4 protein n=1 Tax=Paenibacillus cremeus TaxID=2163881 RepID=A0A559KCC4_9BACL|nr:glycosyltransferase family 4 protein [Paenibacillus cremeus]TVY09782.1 glycosyltransferase family 4 protein [Paenibacillus cremeus]